VVCVDADAGHGSRVCVWCVLMLMQVMVVVCVCVVCVDADAGHGSRVCGVVCVDG